MQFKLKNLNLYLSFMDLLHVYMCIAIPFLVLGSPAPHTVANPSTKSVGSSGISNGHHFVYNVRQKTQYREESQ